MGKGSGNWYLACSLPNYQQGTLCGYEAREYLLHKWGHQCVYCDKQNVPLQVEHLVPRAKGGTDRVSNLVLACETCNLAKGLQDVQVFLAHKPVVLVHILAQVKVPLRDAAAVNTTRWALYEQLKTLGLPIECGSGALSKYNRTRQGLPKTHWLDAACVGVSTPAVLHLSQVQPLTIRAYGHGRRQMCLMDRYGFPRTKSKQTRPKHGFRTGDVVRAVVPQHLKHAGTYVGRVAAKASGAFTITTATAMVPNIGYRYCRRLQRADGYGYALKKGGGASSAL